MSHNVNTRGWRLSLVRVTCQAGNQPGSCLSRIPFGILVSACKGNNVKSNFLQLNFVDESVKYEATSHLKYGIWSNDFCTSPVTGNSYSKSLQENPRCIKAISNPLVPHNTRKPGSKRVARRAVDPLFSRSGDRLQDCQLDVFKTLNAWHDRCGGGVCSWARARFPIFTASLSLNLTKS